MEHWLYTKEADMKNVVDSHYGIPCNDWKQPSGQIQTWEHGWISKTPRGKKIISKIEAITQCHSCNQKNMCTQNTIYTFYVKFNFNHIY